MKPEGIGPLISFTDKDMEVHMRLTWFNVTQSVYGRTDNWLGSEVCLLGTQPQFLPSRMEKEL